jgi:hypothetical protein
MTNIVTKLRDLLNDNLEFNEESQEYLSGDKVFALQYASIDSTTLIVKKNGTTWAITPVAGANVSWSRTGTAITITKTGHNLITGDSITVTVNSSVAAFPLGAYTVTKLTDNTFTIVGLNAGTASGTCTYTIVANYSYSSSTGKVTITGTLSAGDVLTFDYSAHKKYSTSELQGRIRSALYYISANQYRVFMARPNNTLFPTPSDCEESLIAIVAAILINGNLKSYKTSEFTMIFDTDNISVEKRIQRTVSKYKKSFGVYDYVDLKAEEAEIETEDE